ncbi:MAG: dTDP-4-dehydrorhamnose reductase [bacterium]|nr:dTDP-4-dehydrorhamnose reductase [bacterium]
MTWLLIGRNGMLGSVFALKEICVPGNLVAVDIDEIDVTDPNSVEKLLNRVRPNVVLNCSAYTNVDGAETEKELSWAVNVTGVQNLVRQCKNIGAFFIHYSTDFIFNGEKKGAYDEDNSPFPINQYGLTKLEGERSIKNLMNDNEYLIIRTSWLFGPRGKNFISTILSLANQQPELKVVNDQRGNPTYTRDLAQATIELYKKKASGIFHVTNTGSCSWFELARFAVDCMGKRDYRILPVSSNEFVRPAKRPANSVLNTEKFYTVTSYMMPKWQDAVKRYIDYQFAGTSL